MKRLFCIVSIITLTCVGYSYGQEVAVVYDAALENGNVLGTGDLKGIDLADLIVEKLADNKINGEIVDGEGLIKLYECQSKRCLCPHTRQYTRYDLSK